MTHKEWVDNEYAEWVKALQESTVHNFKEHPMVKRMLGEPDRLFWKDKCELDNIQQLSIIDDIEQIGGPYGAVVSGRTWRHCYYAQQILKLNPSSICEIGGGVGQFYAILRALGYKGDYWIMDLREVKQFQYEYLAEVTKQTGLDLSQDGNKEVRGDFLVSFYALGEFTDSDKDFYRRAAINQCPHGYVAWNAHSGASDDLSIFEYHPIKVTPGIEEGIKIVQW